MQIKYYQVTLTPGVNALREQYESDRQQATDEARVLRDELGAKAAYWGHSGKIAAVTFHGVPDMSVYRSVKGGYFPRKNTNAGREMLARFESVKALPELRDCGVLELFGAKELHCLSGMTLYRSLVVHVPEGPLFIGVPWDETPLCGLEAMDPQPHINSLKRLAKWSPSEGLREVRKWEVEKAIDEYHRDCGGLL